jgi:hypothetical protein
MSPAKSKTKATGKQLVIAPGKQLAKPFNAKATGERVAKYLAAAQKAAETYHINSRAADAILDDVVKDHPEQMREVCKHAGLNRSRTAELMAVASGRKTMEEVRAANAERQRRFKTSKKAKALPPPKSVTTPPVTDKTTGNDHDPEETAAAMGAAHAAAEADAEAEPTAEATEAPEGKPTEEAEAEPAEETADEKPAEETEPVAKAARSRSAKPKPPVDVSKKALAELRVAVDTWLPRITDADDRQAALNYVTNAVLLMGTKTEVAA